MNPGNSDDTVHNPELPGVRTYKKDTADEKAEFSFGGIKLTVPAGTVGESAEKSTPKGGSLGSNKGIFDVERAFNDEAVQEGTIVTDHKHRRMSIGNMLKSAFTEWWGNTQQSLESTADKFEFLKPKEEPTIENAESRVSIIQEAAKYARQAPRDDHSIVVEKVRTFAHDAEAVTGKPFTIKEPAEKIGAHWSQKRAESEKPAEPVSEKPIPTADLRASTIAPNVEKRISTPLATYAQTPKPEAPKIPIPSPNPATSQTLTPTPTVSPVRTPEKMPGKAVSETAKGGSWSFFKDAAQSSVDLREKVNPVPRPDVVAPRAPVSIRIPAIPAPEIVHEAPRAPEPKVSPVEHIIPPKPQPPRPTIAVTAPSFEATRETARSAYVPTIESRPIPKATIPSQVHSMAGIPRSLIYGTIVLVGVGLGVFTAVLVVHNAPEKETLTTVPTPVVPNFIPTDTTVTIPLSTNTDSFSRAVLNEMAKGSASIEYIVTGEDGSVVSSNALMRVLGKGMGSSFVHALNAHFMLGSIETTHAEPFIILQSSNFDVAFAGMLAWENQMPQDLTPLFGESLPKNMSFTDALKSNRSIRLLKDTTGKEHIVYAFVNKNLIIITTSTEALSQIIDRIK